MDNPGNAEVGGEKVAVECPSCRVHPHLQACSLNCEDARIASTVSGLSERIKELEAELETAEDEALMVDGEPYMP